MNRYFKWLYCVGLCLTVLTLQSKAQQVKVNAKLDKSTIALGDQTILRLSVQLASDQKINFPALSDTLSAKIQIVEMGKTDTVKDANNAFQTITRAYTITSFDPGIHAIPSLVFTDAAGSFNTPPIPLEVKEVKVDTTKAIFDIKQPLGVSYTFLDMLRDNWHWLVFGLVVLIMLAAVLYYYRKLRKAKPVVVEQAVPMAPAHVIAIEKLQALNSKKLWQQDAIKEYHSALSDILREYLEHKYQINAMEQTSDEIFASLKHMEIKADEQRKLKQVLLLADLVKFAKARPLNTDNELSMYNAIDFVNGTV